MQVLILGWLLTHKGGGQGKGKKKEEDGMESRGGAEWREWRELRHRERESLRSGRAWWCLNCLGFHIQGELHKCMQVWTFGGLCVVLYLHTVWVNLLLSQPTILKIDPKKYSDTCKVINCPERRKNKKKCCFPLSVVGVFFFILPCCASMAVAPTLPAGGK